MKQEDYQFNSARIYLRLLNKDDVTNEYISWHENSSLTRYYSASGKKFTKSFLIEEIEKSQSDRSMFTFGIFDAKNDKLFGNIKLGPIIWKDKVSDLIIFIGDVSYHGKGLAVEAIKLGIEVAFKKFDLRKLYGGMFRSNISSVKAYLKAGWLIEGIRQGQYLLNDQSEDRILVACFNPEYFNVEELNKKLPSFESIYAR